MSLRHLAAIVALTTACTTPATQVLVQLDTDAPIDRPLSLTVTMHRGTSTATGTTMSTVHWVRGGSTPNVVLPGSFGLAPTPQDPRDLAVTLVIDASLGGATGGDVPLAFRRIARFSFAPGRPQQLPVFLSVRCAQPATGCAAGDTACTVSQLCEDHQQTCGNDATCVSEQATLTALDSGLPDVTDVVDVTTSDASDLVTNDTSDATDALADTPADIDCGTQTRCGTACFDIMNNPYACGGCGIVCAGGTAPCVAGRCQCTPTPPEAGPPDYSHEHDGTAATTATPDALTVLTRMNHWRTSVGLPPFDMPSEGLAAETAHANYCAANPMATCWPSYPVEVSSCPGYTGADPVMRLQANGLTPGLLVESMEPASDLEGMVDASMVNGFVAGVFLNQTFHDLAFASAGGNNFISVFNLPSDAASGPTATFFPPPGLNDFPLSYPIGGGNTAFPAPPGGFPSGPPVSVTLAIDGPEGSITSHALYDAQCNPVPHQIANPMIVPNFLHRFWVIYADSPLESQRWYTASVTGMVGGMPFGKTWSFHTQ